MAVVTSIINLKGGVGKTTLTMALAHYIAALDRCGTGPVYALREAMRDVMRHYDHVLIACPPNLGIITLNGIAISRYFLIPVVPDILSTLGVPLVLDRMADFALRAQHEIFGLGIVVSRFRPTSKLHKLTVMSMRRDAIPGIHPPIFNTIITEALEVAEAADVEEQVGSLRQKFGGNGPHKHFSALADEYHRYARAQAPLGLLVWGYLTQWERM